VLSTTHTKSFTTNYTDADKENGVELDFVCVIGKDSAGEKIQAKLFEKIKNLCESKKLKFAILGDGKTGASLDDISKLSKTNNIAVIGHGHAGKEGHKISLSEKSLFSKDILEKLKEHTDCKNYIVCSCYGGQVIEDLKQSKSKFEEGTWVAAFSSADEISWGADNINILMKYIENIQSGKKIFMPLLARDAIKTIPQTLVFSYWLENKIASETIGRKNRKIYFDVEKFCEYQLQIFNDYINTLLLKENAKDLLNEFKQEFPDVYLHDYDNPQDTQGVNLLELKMSAEEIKIFQERSIANHVLHEDLEISNDLLKKLKFPPTLLLSVIARHDRLVHPENVVRMLLKHNDNVTHGQNVNNFSTEVGLAHTPLTLALEKGNQEIIKVLLEYGADIYRIDDNGYLPVEIFKSPKYENESFFQPALLKANQTVECLHILEDSPDITAFLSSAEIERIIDAQSNFQMVCDEEGDFDFYDGIQNVPTNRNVYQAYYEFITAASAINLQTILDVAIERKFAETVNHLLEIQGLFESLPDAVKTGNLNLVKAYLYNKVNLEQRYEGNTILMLAVKNGQAGIVEQLLKQGASVDVADNDENDLLNLVAASGNLKTFNMLLNAGMKIDGKLQSSLFFAIKNGHLEMTQKLQELGADILLVNRHGKNLFHFALQKNSMESVKTLLKIHPDFIDLPDAHGKSPLNTALEFDNKAAFRYLLKQGANYQLDYPLANQNLKNFNLSNLNLENASFKKTMLIAVSLQNTNLKGVDFTDAYLVDVNLAEADLTGANLTRADVDIFALLSTKSLRNIIIDVKFLNFLSDYDYLNKFKDKTFKDYKDYIENTTNVDAIVQQLVSIINDKTHPLKYRKMGISDYGNTESYAKVIDMGRERLAALLKRPNVMANLGNDTRDRIALIAKTDVYSIEASTSRFLNSLIKEQKGPADKLMDVMKQYSDANSLVMKK